VTEGFVASLARPGGNITGLSILTGELTGKRLEILREIAPKALRVAVLWTPGPDGEEQFRAAELAARAMGIELVSLESARDDDLEKAFETAARSGAGALLVLGSPNFFGLRARITGLAQKHRLPGMYWLPPSAHAAGSWYMAERHRVLPPRRDLRGQDLEGRQTADLPVEQPTKFELIINLKTAKALGLTILQCSCCGRTGDSRVETEWTSDMTVGAIPWPPNIAVQRPGAAIPAPPLTAALCAPRKVKSDGTGCHVDRGHVFRQSRVLAIVCPGERLGREYLLAAGAASGGTAGVALPRIGCRCRVDSPLAC
jgi:hypothetical protein